MLVRDGIVMVQRPCSKNLVVCGACNARLVHRVAGPFQHSQQAHSAFLQRVGERKWPGSKTREKRRNMSSGSTKEKKMRHVPPCSFVLRLRSRPHSCLASAYIQQLCWLCPFGVSIQHALPKSILCSTHMDVQTHTRLDDVLSTSPSTVTLSSRWLMISSHALTSALIWKTKVLTYHGKA